MKNLTPFGAKCAFALLGAMLVFALIYDLAFALSPSNEVGTFLQRLKAWMNGYSGLLAFLLIGVWGLVEWLRKGHKRAWPMFVTVVAWVIVPDVAVAIENLIKG